MRSFWEEGRLPGFSFNIDPVIMWIMFTFEGCIFDVPAGPILAWFTVRVHLAAWAWAEVLVANVEAACVPFVEGVAHR